MVELTILMRIITRLTSSREFEIGKSITRRLLIVDAFKLMALRVLRRDVEMGLTFV